MVACVERSGVFRGYMQAYSLGLGVVCISTFRKGYACQLHAVGRHITTRNYNSVYSLYSY